MSSAIGIRAAVPSQTEVVVTLSGKPSGLLRFRAGRMPDPALSRYVKSSGTQATHRIDLPHPDMWYLWAEDDHGIGEQKAAVLLENPYADDIGGMIAAQLEEHRLGLDAYVARTFPQASMKSIQYGYAPNVVDYPSVVIANPRWSWTWFGFPYLRCWTYQFTVASMVVRPDELNTLGSAADLAGGIMKILSMRAYNKPTTPGGLRLFNVLAQTGDAQEVQIDDANFGAVGSVQWSGQFLLQDTGH
jgi:hypothetical protein